MALNSTLVDQVIALPKTDRAKLAKILLLSLEEADFPDQVSVDAAWADELDRRAQISNESDWKDAFEVIARIRSQLKARGAQAARGGE